MWPSSPTRTGTSRTRAGRESLIRSLDIGGIEVFYPSHTRAQTEHLLNLARELGIAATASSDYHGPTHKTFSRFGAYQTYDLGEPEVPAKPSRLTGRQSGSSPSRSGSASCRNQAGRGTCALRTRSAGPGRSSSGYRLGSRRARARAPSRAGSPRPWCCPALGTSLQKTTVTASGSISSPCSSISSEPMTIAPGIVPLAST